MKKENHFWGFILKNYIDIRNIAGTVVVAFLISWIMPTGKKFPFEYREGEIWRYSDLVAPFDFAIQKTKEEIRQETKERTLQSPKFYTRPVGHSKTAPLNLTGRAEMLVSKWIQSIERQGILKNTEEGRGKNFYLIGAEGKVEKINPLTPSQANAELVREASSDPETKDYLEEIRKVAFIHFLVPDTALTGKLLRENLAGISEFQGKIDEGETIIGREEIIHREKFRNLQSLETAMSSRFKNEKTVWTNLSEFLLVELCLLLLLTFLKLFRPLVYKSGPQFSFFLGGIMFFSFVFNISLGYDQAAQYIIPLGLFPLVARTFFDTRISLFAHLVLVLITGIHAPGGFEFSYIQLSSGIAGIFSILFLKRRTQYFFSAGLIGVTGLIGYFLFSMLHETSGINTDFSYVEWFGLNSALTLLVYPMIYLAEKTLGFVSDVTLMEWADTNQPLLRILAIKAPGTFQHSIQVANLAEEIVRTIGGNPLLVRAGALYHDIGKINRPEYFIENQSGNFNPHEGLGFRESAEIIIRHVNEGIEIGKEYRLPDQILDFIRSHHGQMKVQYFYRLHIMDFPQDAVNEGWFKYQGILPFSKETAALMMADSIEAASRSMKEYNIEKLKNLVDGIIGNIVQENQFKNAPVSFLDIENSKAVLLKLLGSIYHTRIEYPAEKHPSGN